MATLQERLDAYKKASGKSGDTRSLAERVQSYKTAGRDNIVSRLNKWFTNNDIFVSNYQKRTAGTTGSYDDKFDSGASSWLETVTNQKNNFDIEARAIKSYLETNRDEFDSEWLDNALKSLSAAQKNQESILAGTKSFNDYWSQWDTEESYNQWAAGMKDREAKLNYDLRAGKAEISRLETIRGNASALSKRIAELENTLEARRKYAMRMGITTLIDSSKEEAELSALKAEYDSKYKNFNLDELAAEINDKKSYYTLAERMQSAEALKNDAMSATDFETYAAKGAAIKNPTPKEAEEGVFIFGNRLGGDVEVGNVVTYSRDNYAMMAFGEMNGGGSQYGKSIYHFMTDDEVKIYNYYIGKGDKTNAQKYLESLTDTLNQRKAGEMYKGIEGNTALEMVFGVAAGLDQFTQGVANLFNGDDYIPTSSNQYLSGMIREDLADNGPNVLGSSLGQIGYDLITTGSNMLPSILIGGGFGAALLGASAGGNAKAEMLRMGYSKDQATAYGVLVGASESLLEYAFSGISSIGGKAWQTLGKSGIASKVDNILGNISVKAPGIVIALGKTLGGAAGEAFEEGLQSILEPWFKSFVVGGDIEAPDWEEVAYSSLLGALSGGVFEGIGSAANVSSVSGVGRNIKKTQDVSKLLELGQTYSADSVAYKLAGKINDVIKSGGKVNAYSIGQLYMEEGAMLTEQNVSDLTRGLEELGWDSKSASVTAKAYAQFLEGTIEETEDVKMLLSENQPLTQALIKKLIGENTTAYQRTKGYADLGRMSSKSESDKAVVKPKLSEEERAAYEAADKMIRVDQKKLGFEASRDIARDMVANTEAAPQRDAVDRVYKALNVKGEYGYSEGDGVKLKSSGEAAEVVDVVSTKDGEMKVKLSDGKTVDAKELDFRSEGEALVYETVANLGVDPASAWSIIKNYDPNGEQRGDEYALGAVEAFKYGKIGEKNISSSGFAAKLTESQRKLAYDLGRFNAKNESEARQKRISEIISKIANKKKASGSLTYDKSVDVSSLREDQKVQIGVLGKVAEGLGVKVRLFESGVDENGKSKFTLEDGTVISDNGWYDPDTGEIWVDVNAGDSRNGLILITSAHELTHFIKDWSPAKYKEFADFLVKTYGESGKSVDEIVRAHMDKSRHDLTYDEAFDEIVARSCESFLMDRDVEMRIIELTQRDKTLAQKIKTFIGQLLAKLKKIAEDLGLKPDSEEGRLVSSMTDSLRQLHDLWVDALADAGKSYGKAGANGEKGKVQFAERNSEAYDYTKPFHKQVEDYINGKFPVGDSLVLGATPEVLQKIGFNALPMTINQKHVDYALNGTKNFDHEIGEILLKYLPAALKNPVAIITSKTEKSTSVVAILSVTHNGKQINVPVYIDGAAKQNGVYIDSNAVTSVYARSNAITSLLKNALNDESNGNIGLFYWDKKRAIALLSREKVTMPNVVNTLSDGYVHSIREKASPVKPKIQNVTESQQFKRWFGDWQKYPDKASKVVNADGTPKVFYHGTKESFTVFDKKKAKSSGLYGKGFYFTDSKSHSASYGDAMAVYLNIRKPLSPDSDTVTKSQIRDFLSAVAENEDYSIENYGTYDVEKILAKITSRDAFSVIQDINATAIGNFVEAVELFNSVNGTKYDGIVVPTETVAFYPEQIKSATDNIGTFDSKNPDIRYSERNLDAVTNREVLATALESAAQNDIERERLAEYKAEIAKYDALGEELRQVRADISAIYNSTGKRDTERLRGLKDRATELANNINTYDKRLLRLEAAAPLRNVIKREVDSARYTETVSARQKVADARLAGRMAQGRIDAEVIRKKDEQIKAIREQRDRKLEEQKQNFREQKERAAERRDKTSMRNKIRDRVDSLNKLLLNPTKEKHVPMHLQKPVAELLSIVNMEASDNENVKARLQVLKAEYEAIAKSKDPIIAAGYHPEVAERIGNVAEFIGDTALKDMDLEQLDYLYETLTILESVIRKANKGFKIAKGQTIESYAQSTMDEIREVGGEEYLSNTALDALSKYRWNNLKPVYAFERIGSKTFTELFNNVRAGEDVWATDVSEARSFFLENARKYGYFDWDLEKTYSFKDKFGKSFELTLPQMMSLYAYSKRGQADLHLEEGGFVYEDDVKVKRKNSLGIPVSYTVKTANTFALRKEHLATVIVAMSEEQRAFVDAMQDYLSTTMGAKGNEVAREMYGIDLFKETNYFPLKSSSYYLSYNPEKDAQAKIKNYGMAKELVKNANNPIVLSDFMKVWGGHVDEMSMYHAFVLPMEDFSKVFNFNTPTSDDAPKKSVQAALKNAYGDASIAYIKSLLTDLNGGARSDPTLGFVNSIISKFKKAKVFLSWSVIVQQPSAIGRAFALINPKYFKPNLKQKHNDAWAELKKYAPVAVIKEMGYFDTNVGQSTVDYLAAPEYRGLREKAKGIFTDENYRDAAMGKLPSLADELTWNYIWQAVKQEISDTTDLEAGSEEFLKAAGARFTEIVTKTQVYDSVLSRSAFMRSKDGLAKMITAFLAEPTTSANMMGNAILQSKRGNKKILAATTAAVATSVAINSVLVSLIRAMRDDDEDETFTEKYVESLVSELLDGINPATYLPIVKDIWSIAQGYDVERTDMSLFADLIAAVETLFNDNKTILEKVEGLSVSGANLAGIPLENVIRDIWSVFNLARVLGGDIDTTRGGLENAGINAVRDTIPFADKLIPKESKSDKLYEAILSGDKNEIKRAEGGYSDKAAITSALRKALRENDARIKAAAQARYDGDISEYKRIAKAIIAEGYFSQDDVVAAINAEINAIKNGATVESDAAEAFDKVTSIFKASDINAALAAGDTDTALSVTRELLSVKYENELAEAKRKAEELGERFIEWRARKDAERAANTVVRKTVTEYWKPLYLEAFKNRDVSEMNRIRKLLYGIGIYGNLSELDKTLAAWKKS